jgi:predicted tellurium resistance membrane protein TerC
LGAALVMRLLLLLTLKWILGLTEPIFTLPSVDFLEAWMTEEVYEVSWRDIILLAGGLFLVGKSVHEIHEKLEGPGHGAGATRTAGFASVLIQIAILDIIFSLDSVITAVGMANELWVMIVAIILAIGVMLVFAGAISRFVERHPTLKMLALSFLILIGVMLIAEGIGTPINKGYIYFAMAFALMVEVLNLRIRTRVRPQVAA